MQSKKKDHCEEYCSSCIRCLDWFPVVITIGLISFGVFSMWFLVMIPGKWWSSVPGLCGILIFHAGLILLSISYYKAIATPPGSADLTWIPENYNMEELEKYKVSVNKKEAKQKTRDFTEFYNPRWCSLCNGFKPPRAHHCRDLNRCVLRMDHYCPWVHNCVGYRNHKFFILFLVYATFCMALLLICDVFRFYYLLTSGPLEKFELPIPLMLGFMGQVIIMFPVTFCVGGLCSYQLSLLFENCTSIESMVVDSYKRDAKKRGLSSFRWFYDFGTTYNIKQVMGPTIGEWFLPVTPEHIKNGDGISFKTRIFSFEGVTLEDTNCNLPKNN